MYIHTHTHTYECACADIDMCSYPNLSKEQLIAQETPCCSQRESPDFEQYVILIQSYDYSEMITLFPIKVPVKKYSNLDWIRQAKNTDLTSSSCMARKLSLSFFPFLFSLSGVAVRKTHWVSECTTAGVFRDNIWLRSFILKCQLRNTAIWIGLGRLRTRISPIGLSLSDGCPFCLS
jgi:hypothetical protein